MRRSFLSLFVFHFKLRVRARAGAIQSAMELWGCGRWNFAQGDARRRCCWQSLRHDPLRGRRRQLRQLLRNGLRTQSLGERLD